MLNKRALLFLAIAALLGLGAVFTARNWLESRLSSLAPGPLETVPVVIARVSVPVGSTLLPNQLDTAQWPRSHTPEGVFSSKDAASGRVVRRPLAKGELLLEPALLPEGAAAGLVSVIQPEMRAVSVKVDAVIGVAGFVKPGARVDVIATLRRIDLKQKLPYTKVVLQDVRVLAIDQKLEEAQNGEAKLVSVVTLEVDPKQAERLTYISHEGRLQLALRNPGDHASVETKSTGVVDLLPRRSRRGARKSGTRVQVIKGAEVSSRVF
jgi:pilus assembly protein CpaB